jgi:hypothetical protein
MYSVHEILADRQMHESKSRTVVQANSNQIKVGKQQSCADIKTIRRIQTTGGGGQSNP